VTFTWEEPQGSICREEGFTRDISVRGVYIYATTCPPPDAVVQVDIILPQMSRRQGSMVRGKLRTLRVEQDPWPDKRNGFSATGKGLTLCPLSHQRPTLVKPMRRKKKNGKTTNGE